MPGEHPGHGGPGKPVVSESVLLHQERERREVRRREMWDKVWRSTAAWLAEPVDPPLRPGPPKADDRRIPDARDMGITDIPAEGF